MAEYKMKGGVTLTDADFEHMATEAEAGVYPGTPGEWIVRPQGRPRIAEEELVVVTCKVPRSQRDALDRKAESLKESRSQFMRDALNRALAAE